VFAVNVRGMFQVTRAAVPMLRAARGSIVNTASIVGLRPGLQPLPYATSKAAVVSLTKLLAINLGPDIRVNAVAPGWMEGDWMQRTLAGRYDDLMARRAKATPLKRVIEADDVAEVIVNLIVSNKMVNGEIIVVDGGFASST
jgi:3-oxoacyl-[acyl-carrier protein] reductase